MSGQFEFTVSRQEDLITVEGPAAAEVMRALFKLALKAGRLEYHRWDGGQSMVAACWFPPDRLEVRVPAGAEAASLRTHLLQLRRRISRPTPFGDRVLTLITRLEAWSYADSDVGAGPAESMANDLRALSLTAPSEDARRAIRQAQDALDDGMPAEVVAGALYRVLRELEGETGGQASGLGPSGSG
jgi:hypothetical protein